MNSESLFSSIVMPLEPHVDSILREHYKQILVHTLKIILPEDSEDGRVLQTFFCHKLPFITRRHEEKRPGILSFFLLCKYRPDAFKFFFNMVSLWLMPGKRLNVVLIHAVDFSIPKWSDQLFTLCEVSIRLEEESEFVQIMNNLPLIETEMLLGVASGFFATRILEMKGMSIDSKMALIHQKISYLMKRFPNLNPKLFSEMQYLLVACPDFFKKTRTFQHLCRLIVYYHLLKQKLVFKKRETRWQMSRRLLSISTEDGVRLGVLVVVKGLTQRESLEKGQFLKAIQQEISDAEEVTDSFLHLTSHDSIHMLYLEVTRKEKRGFTTKEKKQLKAKLPDHLRTSIEQLMPPLFMPRNEEELMRHMLMLGHEIKYLKNPAHLVLHFHEQTLNELVFVAVLVRLEERQEELSISNIPPHAGWEFTIEAKKELGIVRKKKWKRAYVIKIHLPKERFIRTDLSIDLIRARQMIVKNFKKEWPELRDFNGGTLSQEYDLLEKLKKHTSNKLKVSDFLIENFFFSLRPHLARTLSDVEQLSLLFLTMFEQLQKRHGQEGSLAHDFHEPSQSLTFSFPYGSSSSDELKRVLHHCIGPNLTFTEATLSGGDKPAQGFIVAPISPLQKDEALIRLKDCLHPQKSSG